MGGYGLDDQGLIPERDRTFLLISHPNQLWGLPSLISNEYQRLLTWRQSGWSMKVASSHLIPRLRRFGALSPFPYIP
jgi:hypothetical protein